MHPSSLAPWRSRRPRHVGSVAATLWIGFFAAAGCGSEVEPPAEVLRPVRSVVAELRSAAERRTFSGTARAGQETQLSFRVSGRVERVPVRVGQQVRRGDLVAGLERRDFELQVQQSKANLAQVEANRRNAEANLERVRGLWENDNTSQTEMDSARAQAEAAIAQVDSSQRALEVAERQLSYTRLFAPLSGAIASVDVEANENVSAGQIIALLASEGQVEVEVAMPEVLISGITTGMEVGVGFDAAPGETFTAQVTEVGVAATRGATFPVTVQLERVDSRIRSGMAADVEFEFSGAAGVSGIYLPAHAVGEDRQGRFVLVLERATDGQTGTVRRRPVTVGDLSGGGELHVISGVEAGERIITAGVRRLIDGQQVKLLDADR